MILRKDLPMSEVLEGDSYPLSAQDQTIFIELSFINGFLLNQIRMPMVTDMLGGDLLIECFQKCLCACILTFMKADLLTEEFFNEHEAILDEQSGIKDDLILTTMEVSDLSYDLQFMIERYMVICGYSPEQIDKKDKLCGNAKFFLPHP